tara:strand:- start:111 stop:956 length:846 start_codon:yes stop_codon:yes gene_type:complete
MYFLQNIVIWIRKNLIRILKKEYPNKLLLSSTISKNKNNNSINLVSSTNNFWVSKSMEIKWNYYNQFKDINVNIYSNEQVNNFMQEHFKDNLIYEIFKRSKLPVQKIDIFRICCIYKFGGIWLDLKSEVNLKSLLNNNSESNSKGFLLYEPRKIEVIRYKNKKIYKTFENVIHNGFFFLPKGSIFLENLIKKITRDFLYFQDIVFERPKDGIMNLTGPHQFTRSFYDLPKDERPNLISHEELGWIYCSKYGEYLSPLNIKKHYSSYRKLKTIDSKKRTLLE